jgi:hypothetical protein
MSAFEELEEKYPEIVKLMAPKFDSHQFILALAQKYQKLYVQALSDYADKNKPYLNVHREIAKRLKKRKDLVKHIDFRISKNIFGEDSKAAVWEKVKR